MGTGTAPGAGRPSSSVADGGGGGGGSVGNRAWNTNRTAIDRTIASSRFFWSVTAGRTRSRGPDRSRRQPRDGNEGCAAQPELIRGRRHDGARPQARSPNRSARSGRRAQVPGTRRADTPKSAHRAPGPEHSLWSRSVPSPGVHPLKHVNQVLAKLVPWTVTGLPTRDEDIVAARNCELRKHQVCQCHQAAACAVPLYRIPHLATRREPDAHHAAQTVRCALQHQARRHTASAPATQSLEILPIPKPRKRAHHPVRRSVSCGPWHVGWQAPGGQPWWPCGRETRAVSCGPADSVDTCVS